MSVFNGRASDIEDNRNKVSTINENSTDAQYPSAKAVYDAMQSVTVDYSLVANALKGSASGGVVAIKDISPLPHTVLVKALGGGVGDELLTKTETLSTKGATVMLNTPAESVRVVVRGGAYCVGGLVPMVDGDNLTASESKDELALWPTWSYGEAPGNYDLVYTVSGNTLSWSGTKYYEFDGVIEQSKDISGSVELSTSGQKIIGFCQVYSLDEDNPFAESPEYDNLDMTVAIYESTPSVEVKVYGKNLCDFKAFKPYSGGTITLLENGLVYTGRYYIRLDGSFMKPSNRYYFSWKYETSDNIVPIYRIQYADDTYSSSIQSGTGITITKEVKNLLLYPEITGTVHTTTLTDIQIETGMAVSEYEPYIEPTTYTVNSDGTVTGVTSVYPSMTLFSDTDGIELSVEYNRDINKAFAQLQAALISMGGNI